VEHAGRNRSVQHHDWSDHCHDVSPVDNLAILYCTTQRHSATRTLLGAGTRGFQAQQKEILGYHHRLVIASVAGTGLMPPLGVGPYGLRDTASADSSPACRQATRESTLGNMDIGGPYRGAPPSTAPPGWNSTMRYREIPKLMRGPIGGAVCPPPWKSST
jgi:hypothetical protein